MVGASWLFGCEAGFRVAWLAWLLQLLPGVHLEDLGFSIFMGLFDAQLGTVAAFATMAPGLFATRVWREGELAIAWRTFKEVLASIIPRCWAVFGVLCAALVVVKVALFNPLFDLTGMRQEYWLELGDDSLGPRKYRALRWVNDLVAEAGAWLPALMVVVLLLKESGKAVIGAQRLALLPVVGPMLAMGFVHNAVLWALVDTLKRLLFPLFTIPFEASLIPYVLQFALLALVAALLLPAWTLANTVPFELWAGPGTPPAPNAFSKGPSPDRTETHAGTHSCFHRMHGPMAQDVMFASALRAGDLEPRRGTNGSTTCKEA